jgi:hypothetical protein
MGADDISLWPFAVKPTVWLYNRVPNQVSGLTPLELITKQKGGPPRHPTFTSVGLSSVRART